MNKPMGTRQIEKAIKAAFENRTKLEWGISEVTFEDIPEKGLLGILIHNQAEIMIKRYDTGGIVFRIPSNSTKSVVTRLRLFGIEIRRLQKACYYNGNLLEFDKWYKKTT